MKIVIIAGYSSKPVREHLKFKKDSRFYHGMIKLLGLPERVGKFSDTVPWVSSIINDLRVRPDMELHVIAPHIRLKERYQEFVMDGVQYHYYPAEWTSLLRLSHNYRIWKWLQMSKYHAKHYLDQIKPDIVLLSGAENPVTSGCIFGARDYPRICLCQTVYNDPDMAKYNKPDHLRQLLELDIFQELKCFGVYCKKHYDLLMANSHDRLVFRFNYPGTSLLLQPVQVDKKFDFLNFAQLHSAAKGSPDSIKALAIVKQRYPNVTLNIVGGCDEKMRAELDEIIHENGLENNVIFTPFFEKKEELLLHIQKSRFAVLPCKLDNTSGTMSQSMWLNIPIVVYKTMGTPAFNKVKQCALIAEMDDVEGLARHMITLMEDPKLAKMLAKNGRWYKEVQTQQRIDNWNKMVENLPLIVEYFRKGTPIPAERLYRPGVDD